LVCETRAKLLGLVIILLTREVNQVVGIVQFCAIASRLIPHILADREAGKYHGLAKSRVHLELDPL
jgi:hypothetical protein